MSTEQKERCYVEGCTNHEGVCYELQDGRPSCEWHYKEWCKHGVVRSKERCNVCDDPSRLLTIEDGYADAR